MDHSPRHDDDDDFDRRESRHDKFKRERDERGSSPNYRRYSPKRRDDMYRSRHSRSRSRSRERYSGPRSDSRRYAHSPDRPRGNKDRDSPPFKRRKHEEDWDHRGSRSPSPRRSDDGRGKGSRSNLFDGPMLSYKQFQYEQDDDRLSTSELEKKYEEYQQEYKRRQARVFFNEHKDEEWFKEKYEPTYLTQKRDENIVNAKNSVKTFAQTLKDSSHNWNLTATLEDIRKNLEASRDDNRYSEKEEEHSEESSQSTEGKLEEISQENGKSEHAPIPPKMESSSIFIKAIPPQISRNALLEIFKKHTGFKRMNLSEPQRFKGFNRLGWVFFDTPENAQTALKELAGHTKVGDFELPLGINKSSEAHKLPKITPPVASEESRIKMDLEQAKLLSTQLDKEKSIEDNPLFLAGTLDNLTELEQLDRFVWYLRQVHLFCYYCGEEFDDEEEMLKKCEKHLRGAKRDPETVIEVSTDQWALSLDTKIKNRIQNPENSAVFTGQKLFEKKLEKFFSKHVSKIEEQKFSCLICNKLFMGENFVRKHQQLKHVEKIDEVRKKATEKQFFENYVNDPKRIPNGPMQNRNTPQMRKMGWGPVPMDYRYSYGSPQSPYFQNYTPRYKQRKPQMPRSDPRPMRPLEPPPGVTMDPRALKEYVDLDAPAEQSVQIDYRIGDLRKKRENKSE